MQFVDFVKLNVSSGSGGDGCSSFRREKFIPRGGPDGGDGGKGGDVLVRGTADKTTLLDFRFRQHLSAGRGSHGLGKDKHGRTGDHLMLEVPLGTVIRDAITGELLMDVTSTEPEVLMEGGLGGRGNSRFKTSTNRAPERRDEGKPGVERILTLELKLMADVGLVGFPNAGKSTLISRISKAHPKIADYPFTTLVPNLGVVQAEAYESFVVADIPGIIEGAHEGAGLGHQFLRHIERTAMLALLLDLSESGQPPALEEYGVLLQEMGAFSPGLLDKPRLVVLTKRDAAPDPKEVEKVRQKLEAEGEQVFVISAVAGEGLTELIREMGRQVRERRKLEAPVDDPA